MGPHQYTHTPTHKSCCIRSYNDWLFFCYLMFQPMVSFHFAARGNWLPNACSEKTHSYDLDQIEPLPSARDNSGLEWQQNLKEVEQQDGQVSLQRTFPKYDNRSCVNFPFDSRCIMLGIPIIRTYTIKAVCIQLHRTSKALCLYIPIFSFVIRHYKLLWDSRKSMAQHSKGNGFCFLCKYFGFWGNRLANKEMH